MTTVATTASVASVAAGSTTSSHRRPIDWRAVRTVARTDLRQLIQARDFWIPMMALGAIFFFVIPTILLLVITRVSDVHIVQQLSTTLGDWDRSVAFYLSISARGARMTSPSSSPRRARKSPAN